MTWSTSELARHLPNPWRLWARSLPGTPGAAGPPAAASPGEEGSAPARMEDPRPPEHGAAPGDGVFWHRVGRGEGWADLVARYNIADPLGFLEANGLQAPRPLVPGEWIAVPCELVQPVWEIALEDPRWVDGRG